MCNSRITPSIEDAKHLKIPLRDIARATNEFANENLIAKGGFGSVYKGISEKHGEIAVKRWRLRERGQGDHQFKMEIALQSKYKHENIVPLLRFCDEDDEKILVYKYESNGSLDTHLNNENLTYNQRLQICQDAARGLSHVHDKDGSQNGIFHRDVKCANILLDENWNAKISDFGLSRYGPDNMQSSYIISDICGTPRRIAPEYYTDGYFTAKSDVYSFGIVLWEVLCGRNIDDSSFTDDRRSLNVLVRKHYKKGTLDSIIPLYLRKQIKPASLLAFAKIAYQCLKNEEERPTMMQVVEQLEKALDCQLDETSMYLSIEEVKQLQQIPLQDILSATNEFADKNFIRSDRSENGKVYEGTSEKYGRVVILRLDSGIRNLEFMTEIAYHAEQKHKKTVSFLGYCDDGGERIIVYRDESIGTLDEYLESQYLNFSQRIKMGLELSWLNSPVDKRLLITSDIFLDKDMKPTFSSSEWYSIIYPANKQPNFVVTNPCGRPGYIDQDDFSNGDLSQKSHIYSLGVVLWQLLCGRRLSSDKDDPQSLLNLVRKHYKNQTLDRIIPSFLFKQMNKDALATFSSIAYRCVNNEEEQPTLREVEEQLQKALDQQLHSDCSSH